MAGNRLAKVLDLEGPLETRGKETTEWCNQRSERGEDQDMELDRLDPNCRSDSDPVGDVVRLKNKGRVRCALKPGQDVGTEVVDGANEILVAHEDVGHEVAEPDGADPGPQETLDRLLWRELDQLCSAERYPAYVGEDIIRNDERSGQEEPDHTLQHVVHDKMRLHDDQIERHMGPCELRELEAVVALFQGTDEENKTHHIEHEADEAVVGRQGQQHLIHQQNVFEVVDDTFSIQEIHRSRQKIPVQRFGKAQILLFAGHVGNRDHLLKRHDLDRGHDANNVDVAGEHGDKEAGNHDKRPYRPRNKRLFLLFVFGQLRLFWFLYQRCLSVTTHSLLLHDLILGSELTSSGMVDGAAASFPSPPLATAPAALAPLGSDGASLASEPTLMRLFSLIEFDRR